MTIEAADMIDMIATITGQEPTITMGIMVAIVDVAEVQVNISLYICRDILSLKAGVTL